MPHLFDNIWCVYKEELVPKYWSDENNLYCEIQRYKNKNYGIKRVTSGGNGRKLRIDFYSLKEEIQKSIGDPQHLDHFLLNYFEIDQLADDYYETIKRPDGTHLTESEKSRYVTNASTLKALIALEKARITERVSKGATSFRGVMRTVFNDLNGFNDALKEHYGLEHNLPTNYRRFMQVYKPFKETSDYKLLIKDFKGKKKKNAVSVKTTEQIAVLRQLIGKHNNFDNEQIATIYNEVAKTLGWKDITGSTVANYRPKVKLTTESGRRGKTHFDTTIAMQHKRKAPEYPLYYWTADGWDVELLYQKTETTKNGHSHTTYHNRLNCVVVLDPCCKYPIGYAIGTHETPDLIRQAFRNAVKHTEELFGTKHKVHQLQTDRYAIKKLTPFYQAVSKHFTPARVKNAKSKVIEPRFAYYNKKYFQMMPNWSGFGVTGKVDNQPNSEYLNKIRHSFPDELGCRMQIERALEMERESLKLQYMKLYNQMPQEHKLYMDDEFYLYRMGETSGFTNRLRGHGVVAKLNGVERVFDTFDINFRQQSMNDWALFYDPDSPEKVLAVNAKSNNGKLKEVIGSQRFMLEEKHLQPMALIERSDDDANKLSQVNQFNKKLEQKVIDQQVEDFEAIDNLFRNNKLEGTLSKMILVDSNGQHKNNKSAARLDKTNIDKLVEKENTAVEKQKEKSWLEIQNEYIESKTDYSKYL